MTAMKETAKKAEVKEVKKTRNESMKVPKETTTKEAPKVPKATTKVPPKKETPKKNESISKNDVKCNVTKEIKKETTQVPKATTKEVGKEPTKEKSFEKRPSAGKQIREMFESILPKLKNEHLEILTSAEKTKETLKIRYAFLKEVKNEKDERKVNGHARYNKTIVKINNKDYYICNDLYERNIETFKAWCETIK